MNTTINHALPTLLGLITKETLLLLAAALACRLLRRSSAATRHLIWSAALIGVLLLPLLSASLPHWNAVWGHAAASSSAAAPMVPVPTFQASGSVSATTPAVSATPMTAGPGMAAPAPFPWAIFGLIVWSLGTLSVLAHLAVGLRRVGRVWATSQALAPEERLVLETLRRQLGLRRVEALRATGCIGVPVTWGTSHSRVLLPSQSHSWSEECLRAVLLHELAHVQRRDWTTQTAARLACAFYWWHPLVWWAAGRARAEGERACDDLALDAGMRPSEYARRLVEVMRLMPTGTSPPTAVIAMARPSEVTGRVQAVLARGGERGRVSPKKMAGLLMSAAVCVCFSAVFSPVAATGSQEALPADLRGEVVVVDPGHGGLDTGAVGVGGVTEKSLDLAIAQRLRLELEQRGATVFLTRDDDTFLDIMGRPRFAASKHADFLISIHCDDSLPQTYGGTGTHVYYHGHAPLERQLAGSISAGLGRATAEPSRVLSDLTRFSPNGFGVLRGAAMPAVLVECGDMPIPADLARLRDPQGQQRIAEGIASGLSAFRVASQPPTSETAGDVLSRARHIPRLPPDDTAAQYRLALSLYTRFLSRADSAGQAAQSRELAEATQRLQAVIAIQPDNASAQELLGFCLARQRRWAEALTHCRGALEVLDAARTAPSVHRIAAQGDNPSVNVYDSVYALCDALVRDGEYKGTVLRYIQAFTAASGDAFARAGLYSAAVRCYRQALQFDNFTAYVLVAEGEALIHAGHRAEAKTVWKQVLSIDPPGTFYYVRAWSRLAQYQMLEH